MNFSLTVSGVAVLILSMVIEPSEADTIVNSAIVIIDKVGIIAGIVMTYYGRYRQGDITWYGKKV